MGRSKWKGPYITEKALQKLKKNHKNLTVSRNTEILPKLVGQTFRIHNGKKYMEIIVTTEMIGHKFGEFFSTRKKFFFKKKLKNN